MKILILSLFLSGLPLANADLYDRATIDGETRVQLLDRSYLEKAQDSFEAWKPQAEELLKNLTLLVDKVRSIRQNPNEEALKQATILFTFSKERPLQSLQENFDVAFLKIDIALARPAGNPLDYPSLYDPNSLTLDEKSQIYKNKVDFVFLFEDFNQLNFDIEARKQELVKELFRLEVSLPFETVKKLIPDETQDHYDFLIETQSNGFLPLSLRIVEDWKNEASDQQVPSPKDGEMALIDGLSTTLPFVVNVSASIIKFSANVKYLGRCPDGTFASGIKITDWRPSECTSNTYTSYSSSSQALEFLKLDYPEELSRNYNEKLDFEPFYVFSNENPQIAQCMIAAQNQVSQAFDLGNGNLTHLPTYLKTKKIKNLKMNFIMAHPQFKSEETDKSLEDTSDVAFHSGELLIDYHMDSNGNCHFPAANEILKEIPFF